MDGVLDSVACYAHFHNAFLNDPIHFQKVYILKQKILPGICFQVPSSINMFITRFCLPLIFLLQQEKVRC